MTLENRVYREEKIKVTTMQLAALKIIIAQELAKKNYRNTRIKLVCVTDGMVDEYETLEEFLIDECMPTWQIDLLSVKEILLYNEEKKADEINIIIVICDAEDEE